ncbi:MAG TPA: hypothetical protein VK179_03175 [Bacteroidales bacterium]|nr:hypothetical protein [Bacteroidales bacterium]
MRNLAKYKGTTAFIIAAVITVSLAAQDGDFTKEIKKEFQVNPNTRIELFNKYGNVDIVNSENPQVIINIVINVHERSKERADELLNMIDINISQEDDVIKAVTDFSDDLSKFFRGPGSGRDLQINYTVTMPKTLPLYLSNKYGNVFIDQLVSTSTIDVKYGKLTANKILHDSKQPLTKIYLSYSNGTIQETKWIEADIKYSKLNITESKALAIVSKYSKLYITNGSSVVSESKYDTYEVEKLSNFVTTAAYGHFNIGSLTGKLQVDTKYTDVIVDHIAPTFEGIKVNNSYGTYKLAIDPAASYHLDAYAKYCNITYPEGKSRLNRINENNETKLNGLVGSDQAAKADVSVTSHYGNIRLVE